ncbi:MAG: ABC-type transport auxiliary lipoprotein family protein [Desulfovermiculus sp.]
MPGLRAVLALFLCFWVGGCGSLLRTETAQPVFYRLQPKQQTRACDHDLKHGLRVWDLDTSAPFDRTRMAVMDPQEKIVFSRENQWADLPGIMIAEVLYQDLSQAKFVQPVIYGMPGIDAEYELAGRVHIFACERSEDESRAVLKVELNLLTTKEKSEPLMHKTYTLRSPSFAPHKPDAFVRAMNQLAGKMSLQLQQDLCEAAASFSGH